MTPGRSQSGHRPAILAALVAATLLSASPALYAHGAPPRARQAFALTDPGGGDALWALSTNFGVMSQQAPSRYICEEAFEAGHTYVILPFGPDTWVSLGERHVALSLDGCQIERTHTYDLPLVDAAHRIESQEVVAALANADSSELHYSADAGRTWEVVAIDLSYLRPTGVRFVGEGQVGLSAFRTSDARRGEAVVGRIDLRDGAPRLDRFDVPPALRYPYLLAAADGQLLWHAQAPEAQDVFWSELVALPDPGTALFEAEAWPTAGAISPDGSRAWLSGPATAPGPYVASRQAPATWQEMPTGHDARCITPTDEGLLICGHRDTDGFDLALLRESGELQPLVDFRTLEGPRHDCRGADATLNPCDAVWPELARSLGIDPDVDTPDADEDPTDEDPTDPGQAGESGCAHTPGPVGAGWWAMLVVALGWRRQRPLRLTSR